MDFRKSRRKYTIISDKSKNNWNTLTLPHKPAWFEHYTDSIRIIACTIVTNSAN